jgi:hypothetical protein
VECRTVQDILSAAADGDSPSGADLDAVRLHGAHCAECASFAQGLRRLMTIPSTVAPVGLADTVVGAVMAAAEAGAAEAADAAARATALAAAAGAARSADSLANDPPAAVDALKRDVGPAWLTRSRLWALTGVLTSAAAVFALMFAMNARMSQQTLTSETSLATGSGSAASPLPSRSDAKVTPGAAASQTAAGAPAPVAGPRFIAVDGVAYALVDVPGIDSSALAPLGTVNTALDTGLAATGLNSYRWSGDAAVVAIGLPSGEYRVFRPVERTLLGARYRLAAGGDNPRVGDWPRLPPDLAVPASPDGAPSFVVSGKDDLGVRVFARAGAGTSQGFAIAPPSGTTDPAGANPNWTWWVRVP